MAFVLVGLCGVLPAYYKIGFRESRWFLLSVFNCLHEPEPTFHRDEAWCTLHEYLNNKTTDILTHREFRVFHEVSPNGLKVGLWWAVSTLRTEVQCFWGKSKSGTYCKFNFDTNLWRTDWRRINVWTLRGGNAYGPHNNKRARPESLTNHSRTVALPLTLFKPVLHSFTRQGGSEYL